MNKINIRDITIASHGVTVTDDKNNVIYLQLPVTPDSQCYFNDEYLPHDQAKEYQRIIDDMLGDGDRTLARLCYAGGNIYTSYTKDGNRFIVDSGDVFIEHPYSDFYNVEMYKLDDV